MERAPADDRPTSDGDRGTGRRAGRRRLLDVLLGAAAMLVLLVVAALVLAAVVSEPAGSASGPPAPVGVPAPGGEPPADLVEGEVWLGDLTLESADLAVPDGRLLDVRATGRDVLTGSDGLSAGFLELEGTVPFDVVAAQIGDGVVLGAAPGRLAEVRRTVEVAGRAFPVVATGAVDVVDGRLVVEPRTVDVGAGDFLSAVLGSVVRELVTIEHELEGVPEGMTLQEVVVQGDGFRARLTGRDVRLEPDALAGATG